MLTSGSANEEESLVPGPRDPEGEPPISDGPAGGEIPPRRRFKTLSLDTPKVSDDMSIMSAEDEIALVQSTLLQQIKAHIKGNPEIMQALVTYHALSRINLQNNSENADFVNIIITVSPPAKALIPLMRKVEQESEGGGFTGNSDGAGYTGWSPGPIVSTPDEEVIPGDAPGGRMGWKLGIELTVPWGKFIDLKIYGEIHSEDD